MTINYNKVFGSNLMRKSSMATNTGESISGNKKKIVDKSHFVTG